MPDPEALILDWASLSADPRDREPAYELLASHEKFSEACIEATRWVLHGRQQPHEITTTRLHIAVDYLLAELPLFLDTAAIVGLPASVFCHHPSTGSTPETCP